MNPRARSSFPKFIGSTPHFVVVYRGMDTQLKIKNRLLCMGALVLLGTAALGASGGDEPQRRWKTTPDDHAARRALMTHSGNSGAVMFSPGVQTEGSYYTYERDLAPEYNRRDEKLAITVPDATAGWYAWPVQSRPSLNDRDFFTTSKNPNTFVFPGTDGYSSYDRHQREIRRDRIRENQTHIYIHKRGDRGSNARRNRFR